MSNKLTQLVERINLAKVLANHLFGRRHTDKHRKICGIVVMIAGVSIAKLSVLINYNIVHFMGDGIGYAIHGIGLSPFLSDFEGGGDLG